MRNAPTRETAARIEKKFAVAIRRWVELVVGCTSRTSRQVRKREDDDKAKALSGTKQKMDTSGAKVQLTLAPEWSI